MATPLSFEADLLVVDESRRAHDGFSLLSSPLPDSPLAQAEELPPEFLSNFEPGLMLYVMPSPGAFVGCSSSLRGGHKLAPCPSPRHS